MDTKLQKAFLYRRLMAEAQGFGLEVDEELSAPDRPWGSYIRLTEASLPRFINAYWYDLTDELDSSGDHRLDPKILLVAPGSRLSLQYHHRRREMWRILAGPVKIVLGPDGTSLHEAIYHTGETIEIPCGYWHRITGLSGWSVLAEIWDHTDVNNPSNEEDIVRVEDDFRRGSG